MPASRILRRLLVAFMALLVACPTCTWATARAPVLASASYAPAGRRAAAPYVHPRMHRHRRRRSQARNTSRAFASGIPVAELRLRRIDAALDGLLAGGAHPPDHPPA